MKVPNHYELCQQVLEALQSLGGRGRNKDILDAVASQMKLSEETVRLVRRRDGKPDLEHRLSRARTVLKTCGLITNPARGLWALTEEGGYQNGIDSEEIRRMYLEHRSVSLRLAVRPSTELLQAGMDEDEFWDRLTTEQFFAGYTEEDVLYDAV